VSVFHSCCSPAIRFTHPDQCRDLCSLLSGLLNKGLSSWRIKYETKKNNIFFTRHTSRWDGKGIYSQIVPAGRLLGSQLFNWRFRSVGTFGDNPLIFSRFWHLNPIEAECCRFFIGSRTEDAKHSEPPISKSTIIQLICILCL
jgi:hypothetical protein